MGMLPPPPAAARRLTAGAALLFAEAQHLPWALAMSDDFFMATSSEPQFTRWPRYMERSSQSATRYAFLRNPWPRIDTFTVHGPVR